MELKFYKISAKQRIGLTFNRTAYGIEIKIIKATRLPAHQSFNRTAYGIEINYAKEGDTILDTLLIAPLMELKLISHDTTRKKDRFLLIAPLMELK